MISKIFCIIETLRIIVIKLNKRFVFHIIMTEHIINILFREKIVLLQNRCRKREYYYQENIRCDVQNFGKLVSIKLSNLQHLYKMKINENEKGQNNSIKKEGLIKKISFWFIYLLNKRNYSKES